jgi:tRNA dimethylallyltransferase
MQRPFQVIKIGIEDEREKVYQRINARVDEMVNNGLIEEAQALYPFKHLNSLQTHGYEELFDHFDGSITLEKAIEQIKQDTRNYAKRQWTWWRKDTDLKWFRFGQEKVIVDYIDEIIK